MRYIAALLAFLLSACSASAGGYYVGTGPHPHISFAVKGTVGPDIVHVEGLHAPTTQRGVVDLYRLGVKAGPRFGFFQPTFDVAWARWGRWGWCQPPDHMICEKHWSDSFSTGFGTVLRDGPFRLDLTWHRNWQGHFDNAILITAGYTLKD